MVSFMHRRIALTLLKVSCFSKTWSATENKPWLTQDLYVSGACSRPQWKAHLLTASGGPLAAPVREAMHAIDVPSTDAPLGLRCPQNLPLRQQTALLGLEPTNIPA